MKLSNYYLAAVAFMIPIESKHKKIHLNANDLMGIADNYITERLPKDWKIQKISDISLQSSTINPTSEPDKRFTYLDISSINNISFFIEEPKEVYGKDAPSRARKTVNKNSILFATTRPNLKNIAIIKENYINPVASTGFCVLNPDLKKVLTNYLFYFLITDEVQGQIEPLIRGAQYPAISDKDVLSLQIPLPPLPEQQRIVKKLDSVFERLDKAIALTEENLEHCRHLLPAALNEVFGEAAKTKWEQKKLKEVAEVIMGLSPKGKSYNEIGDGVPLINGPVEFGDGDFEYSLKTKFTTQPTRLCKKDDILICVRGATTGRTNIAAFDACIGRGVAAIRPKIHARYTHYNLNFLKLKILGQGKGSIFPAINTDELKDFILPAPPVHIQKQIAIYLDQLRAKKQMLQQHYTKQLQHLQALKASLLDAAFRGEL